jgi:hypothetical protein
MHVKVSTAIIIAVVCGVLGFGFGFWQQYDGRKSAEASLAETTRQVETLRGQLAKGTDRANMGDLLARFLVVKDSVEARNFRKAQELSTAWFDAVRTESQRTTSPDFKKALESALSLRDQATAALTKADVGALAQMTGVEDAIRSALGFPAVRIAPPSAPAAPAAVDPAPVAPPRTIQGVSRTQGATAFSTISTCVGAPRVSTA